MSFQQKLSFGKVWEQRAAQWVAPQGEVEWSVGACKGWDFKTKDGTKYEVKSDRMAPKYGWKTMYIEYECNRNPSGISSTEADYYIYCMVNSDTDFKMFKVPVPELKKMCSVCTRKTGGGDGGRSRGYVIEVEPFKNYNCSIPQTTAQPPTQPESLRIRLPPQTTSPLGSTNPTPHQPDEACRLPTLQLNLPSAIRRVGSVAPQTV